MSDDGDNVDYRIPRRQQMAQVRKTGINFYHDLKKSINKMENILDIDNRKDFRRWLEQYFDNAGECWICVKRGRQDGSERLWYLDAVEDQRPNLRISDSE